MINFNRFFNQKSNSSSGIGGKKISFFNLILNSPSIILAVLSVALFLSGWHLWTDFQTDIGNNIYTFWQVADGKKLYSEIAYYHGPISPLFNGMLFRIFGTSVEHLAFFHLVITFLIVWQLHILFKKIFDLNTAWLISIFFLFVFAFAQNNQLNSYNFILPYKFEAAYGTFFSITGFTFLMSYKESKNKIFLFFYGITIGLTLLTSVEVAFTNILCFFFVIFALQFEEKKIQNALMILFGGLIPLIFIFMYFLDGNNLFTALEYTFRGIFVPFNLSKVRSLPFYQEISGFNDVPGNLLRIFISFFVVLGLIGIFIFISNKLKNCSNKFIYSLAIGISIVFFLCVEFNPFFSFWREYQKQLSFSAVLIFIYYQLPLFRRKKLNSRDFLLAAFSCFSLLLLSKIFLKPRLDYYGFFLAMPSMLLLIGFIFHTLPNWLETKNIKTQFYRIIIFFIFIVVSILHYQITLQNYELKTIYLGSNKDGIGVTGPEINKQGLLLKDALLWIENTIPKNSNLLMLPEGDIFNYMTRRIRPIPFSLHPLEYSIMNENSTIQLLKKKPPEFIGIIGRDATSLGYGTFGVDPEYGKNVVEWIFKNYDRKIQLGGNPLIAGQMGILFFQLKK